MALALLFRGEVEPQVAAEAVRMPIPAPPPCLCLCHSHLQQTHHQFTPEKCTDCTDSGAVGRFNSGVCVRLVGRAPGASSASNILLKGRPRFRQHGGLIPRPPGVLR